MTWSIRVAPFFLLFRSFLGSFMTEKEEIFSCEKQRLNESSSDYIFRKGCLIFLENFYIGSLSVYIGHTGTVIGITQLPIKDGAWSALLHTCFALGF